MVKSLLSKFPPQIKFIVGNEAAERFSFYGMRSILVIFMVQHLMMPESSAKGLFHLFVSACYLLPLLGAYLSDRYWGKYKTIMILSLFYCLGHGVLAAWESETGMYVGLGLIALGAGGIKPCVSAHVGDQFTKENKHLVQKVFELFYWTINFGSTFAEILIPLTLIKYGSRVAFGIPGILMGFATLVFWMGRKHYVVVPPSNKPGFMAVLIESIKKSKLKKKEFFDNALGKYGADTVEGAKAVVRVAKIFITVSVFWALYDQHSSSWVLQGTKMNLEFMGTKLSAAQVQALNPIMVMILIPFFSLVVYPGIEKLGVKVTPLRKMATGMFVAAFSFVVVGAYQAALDSGNQLNIAWQILPYLILTVAEVLVSITGLEFAYTQAPRIMKSTIMSFWLLTVFLGNIFTAYISQINIFQGPMYFLFFAALMFGVAFVFAYSAHKYKVRDYMES